MSVSVVVPTCDRPKSLERCLEALARQDVEELEVLVIDDGSRDLEAVEAVVRRIFAGQRDEASPGKAQIIRLDGRGPAAARNAGAREASGDAILFTDDDCEPDPAWAGSLAGQLAREDGVVAGTTVAPPGSTAAVAASQLITNHLQTWSLDDSMRLEFTPTSNLGCSPEAVSVLPFDESYPTAAGEDREWSARAVASDMAPRYVFSAVVVHRQQISTTGFFKQQLRYGRGAARFRRDTGSRSAGPGFYLGLVRRGFAEGLIVGALVALAQAAVATGFALERIAGGSQSTTGGPSTTS